MEKERIERKKQCSSCGAEFSCHTQNCWCSSLPNIMPLTPSSDCLCPDCLKKAVEEKQASLNKNNS